MTRSHSRRPASAIGPDWQQRGSVAIGPLLVEHCVAEHHWNEDPAGTAWIGGNNPGWDIENHRGRTDAKTAWFGTGRWESYLQFAAPLGGFAPANVDYIAAAVLTGVRVGFDVVGATGGSVIATYDSFELWIIPVAVVNDLLVYNSRGRSSVPLDAIAAYKVGRTQARTVPAGIPGTQHGEQT